MARTLVPLSFGRLLRNCSLLQSAHEDVAAGDVGYAVAAVALLKFQRRLTNQRAKLRAERSEARVTHQHADLGDCQVGGAQQVLSSLDAAVREVLRGCLAVLRAEAANEVVLRHPGPLGDRRYVEVLGVATVHEVTRAAQVREQVSCCGHAGSSRPTPTQREHPHPFTLVMSRLLRQARTSRAGLRVRPGRARRRGLPGARAIRFRKADRRAWVPAASGC